MVFFCSFLTWGQTDKSSFHDYRNHLHIPKYLKENFPLQQQTTTTSGVWTELYPKVPRTDYVGVDFVDSLTGWLVGQNGVIIKTTTGGRDWTITNSDPTQTLLKVNTFNGKTVIATGYDGLILRSTDEGNNFTAVPTGLPAKSDLWGVQMINDTLGWVCGMKTSLLKTTDDGLSWEKSSIPYNYNLWWLEFVNENLGFIACDSGRILKTIDGGTTWQQLQAGDNRSLYTLDVIDSLHIIAAGGTGKNVYSSDGGLTWTGNNNLIFSSVNCVAFTSVDTGYAIGEEWGIRKTEDRGKTWFASNSNIGEWQIKLLKDAKVGYSVGNSLNIFKTENGFDNWKRVFRNDYYYDIRFINEKTGFALSGALYKTTDSGEHWEKTNGPSGYVLTFTDSLYGYVGGSYITQYGNSVFTVFRTTDGGESWANTNRTGEVDSAVRVTNIFFITPKIGWVTTTGGGILKTTDRGANWIVQLNTYNYIYFSGIHFTDTLNGWVANGNNRPMKTTDGGETWVPQQQIELNQSNDVFFQNINNGWLIESFGLYKTTDAGLTWDTIPGVSGILRKFKSFQEKDHWLIIGGTRFETTDGGDTWQNISDISPPLNSFHSPAAGIAYGCGENGLLVKYVDSTLVGLKDETGKEQSIISSYQLYQNYPNPFNASTRISYYIPNESYVKIYIMNTLGELVKILESQIKSGGEHDLAWNANDLASGIYFIVLETRSTKNTFFITRKSILLK